MQTMDQDEDYEVLLRDTMASLRMLAQLKGWTPEEAEAWMQDQLSSMSDDVQRNAKQMRPATPPPNPLDPNTYVYPDDDD